MRWVVLLSLCLCGCVKTASETATDAALSQVAAVEQQIKKQCPEAKIDKDMDALRASINSQLRTCESEQKRIQSEKSKWQVISLALLGALILLGWFKIR